MEHCIRDCYLYFDQVQAPSQIPTLGSIQSQKAIQQPPRSRDPTKGSNGSNRGQRALGKGMNQTEAQQSILVYTARRRKDKDDTCVIIGMFFINFISYFVLIDFGFMHSFVTSTISLNLKI